VIETKEPKQQNSGAPVGGCCESDCSDCPFGFREKNIDPNFPSELQKESYLDDDHCECD